MYSLLHLLTSMMLGIGRSFTVFINKLECLSHLYNKPNFNIYFNYNKNHLKIRSLYSNVDLYISNLKQINELLAKNAILDKKIFLLDEKELYTIDFLNSRKCVLVKDLENVYAEFYNEAIIFLSNFYYLREIKNPTSTEEYNFMLVGKVYVNLNFILDYFECSDEVSTKCDKKMNWPGC